ncbi:serine/threonine-protein kinase RIO1-like [Daphnia carinata]|uniref:serine/threonine-protein kinase RIO1-like n=1 Tax=Daphnia carinata TaxID=120202 RepID=UPI00257BF0FD|nr:serine/threonine-protein kinase RIO1-like [Daphnia carinata]
MAVHVDSYSSSPVEGQFSDVEDEKESVVAEGIQQLQIGAKVEAPSLSDNENYSDDSDLSDEEFYDWQYDQGPQIRVQGANPNQQVSSNKVVSFQPREKLFKKYSHKINVDEFKLPTLPDDDKVRLRDKADRATAEQVMDPRTRMILFKLMNRGFITQINGCISTGKEANVYHATGKDDTHFALKIYKTSILVFKDRDKYVTGEFRFRHGYCKHNPRKMVRTWAEKELRNLLRLETAGLPCPKPILLRSHVLLMSFIGDGGWPAPRLKEVELSESKARELYRDTIILMRRMFHECRLVHADLSEFNMLYHEGKVFIIDVSQSVEHDHPHALEFLRKDCTNITDFFKKNGVCVMTVKELFDFVVDLTINENNIEDYLDRMASLSAERNFHGELTAEELVKEEVFKQTYIPQRLDEVMFFERDIKQIKSGEKTELVYTTVTGIKSDLSGPQQVPEILDNSVAVDTSDDESSDDSNADVGKKQFVSSGRPRDESPNSRRERKKAIKAEQSEKRKTKVKKHVKKRKEKLAKPKK